MVPGEGVSARLWVFILGQSSRQASGGLESYDHVEYLASTVPSGIGGFDKGAVCSITTRAHSNYLLPPSSLVGNFRRTPGPHHSRGSDGHGSFRGGDCE